MDADELSELAECLQNACDEWITKGGRIAPFEGNVTFGDGRCNCPVGALVGAHYPLPSWLGDMGPVEWHGFMRGFDEDAPGDGDFIALGHLFREQYCP